MTARTEEPAVLVAGGTGNVGSFAVAELLAAGARVAVPSRSHEKLADLRAHLRERQGMTADDLDRLRTFVGDVGDENGAAELRGRIESEMGELDGVVASLGRFVPAPSLLDASTADLRAALDGYLVGHFVVARTFLPALRERKGTYVLVNGPLAFAPWKGSGADLVSIATAGQHMLFRSLAQELEGGPVRVVELVSHAYIRERTTQPGSPLTGEELGAYLGELATGGGRDRHGSSVRLGARQEAARPDG